MVISSAHSSLQNLLQWSGARDSHQELEGFQNLEEDILDWMGNMVQRNIFVNFLHNLNFYIIYCFIINHIFYFLTELHCGSAELPIEHCASYTGNILNSLSQIVGTIFSKRSGIHK